MDSLSLARKQRSSPRSLSYSASPLYSYAESTQSSDTILEVLQRQSRSVDFSLEDELLFDVDFEFI